MKFEYMWVLNGLIIIPVVLFLLVVENRKKRVALNRFAESHLLPLLTETGKKGTLFFICFFQILAIIFLIVALAGPKWGSHYQDVQRKGVDIIFLLDVSKSMEVSDIKPNRLERAKREIADFLKVAVGDRVGLVLFAGDAFIQCPLTLDYEAISMFLKSVGTDTIPVPGTDMGKGIELSLKSFDYKTATDRVIVMITDGEDNEKKGLNKAVEAIDKGVKIFLYGIGEPEGAPVPNENGGFKKDDEGNLILSKLDETTLIEIAKTTDGRYVRSVTGDLDLDRLYFEGIREKTEAKELESGKIKVYEERFYLFAGAALFCLLIDVMLGLKRKKSINLICYALCIILLPNSAVRAENPEKLYREGRFKEAEEAFLKKDIQNPKDVRFRYNRGCAAFKNSDFKSAMAAFKSVISRTDDKDISFKAAYNLGNTFFMQNDYQKAAKYYKEAIKLNPEDKDARYNFELAQKAMEEAKSQQQNSQDKDSKNNEKEQKKDSKSSNNNEKRSDNQENKSGRNKNGNKKEENNRQDDNSNKDNPLSNKKTEPDKPADDSGKGEGKANDINNNRMSKNAAQAFFDNVSEDPSGLNRFRFKDTRRFPASGKDW